jgi:hypothetical protein
MMIAGSRFRPRVALTAKVSHLTSGSPDVSDRFARNGSSFEVAHCQQHPTRALAPETVSAVH